MEFSVLLGLFLNLCSFANIHERVSDGGDFGKINVGVRSNIYRLISF